MDIIFTPYKKISKNEYLGYIKGQKINKVNISNNIELNKKYFISGEICNDIFLAKKEYEYYEFIGTITDIKQLKDSFILSVKNENKEIIKVKTTRKNLIEKDNLHIIKCYGNKKDVLTTLFIKPLTNLDVKIKDKIEVKTNTKIKAEIVEENMLISKEELYLKGNFHSLYKDDIINLYGYKEDKTFVVLNYEKDLKNNLNMTKKYLKNILPKKTSFIEKAIDIFGTDILIKINDKECLTKEFPKMKEKVIDEIIDTIKKSQNRANFYFFCERHEIPSYITEEIYKKYGDASLVTLVNNPYTITEINSELFLESEILNNEINKEKNDKDIKRIQAAIRYYLNKISDDGHMFVFKDDFLNEINPFINKYSINTDTFIEKEYIEKALTELELNEEIKIYKDNDGEKIAFLYNYVYEKESARLLKNIINTFKEPFCKEVQIDNYIKNIKESLADKQKIAIKTALLNNISILIGGPGTGKTFTVNLIVKAIREIKCDASIKLCAPTGRASKRLSEMTNEPATTIHKLLNINQYEKPNEEISEELENTDFLIIDEFSMVDSKLFYYILKNIGENTRLIIIGDDKQLPSVGPGQILKDLLNSKIIKYTELTEIFRQAGNSDIVTIAHKLRKNEEINIDKYKIENLDKILTKNFIFVETISDQNTEDKTYEIIDYLINNKSKNFTELQILCPTKVNTIGTIELNNNLQNIYNKNKNIVTINKNKKFCKGDKVIHIVNNYDMNVMNGSVGYITEIPTEVELSVDYDGDIKKYEYDIIASQLQLAYCITIHKSQGSEYPIVIIPVSNIDKINLNLIYTAITRGKNNVIIIGNKHSILQSFKKFNNNRNTSLLNFLEN